MADFNIFGPNGAFAPTTNSQQPNPPPTQLLPGPQPAPTWSTGGTTPATSGAPFNIFGPRGAFYGSDNPVFNGTVDGSPEARAFAGGAPMAPTGFTDPLKQAPAAATQGPLYEGPKAYGGSGIGNGSSNSFGYINPRDTVTNSILNYQGGGNGRMGLFRL